MKKEAWIDDIMQSLQGQQMADANPFLHTRVMVKIKQYNVSAVPLKWVYAITTCLAVLLLLNVGLFTFKKQGSNKTSVDNIIDEYGLKDSDAFSVIQ
jgi:ABC-type polysaccharide/polyol phosphate export permease